MNPTQLTQMGQVPFYLMPDAHNWMKQAQSADAATLQEIMAKRQREAQLHPLQMQKEQAGLESLLLGNQEKQLGLQKTRALQPKQIDNELLRLAIEADENEWKQTELKIRNGVLQNNPEALKLYEQLPAIREARLKAQQEKDKEKEETLRAFGVAQIGADSRRQVQEMRSSQQAELARIKAAATAKNTDQLMAEYVQKAAAATDPQERAYWNELANVTSMLKAQSSPAGQQPMVDPTKLPGAPISPPTPPQVPASGAAKQPKLAGKAAEDWITRAMSANKGMTREQVIAEGKRLGKL